MLCIEISLLYMCIYSIYPLPGIEGDIFDELKWSSNLKENIICFMIWDSWDKLGINMQMFLVFPFETPHHNPTHLICTTWNINLRWLFISFSYSLSPFSILLPFPSFSFCLSFFSSHNPHPTPTTSVDQPSHPSIQDPDIFWESR